MLPFATQTVTNKEHDDLMICSHSKADCRWGWSRPKGSHCVALWRFRRTHSIHLIALHPTTCSILFRSSPAVEIYNSWLSWLFIWYLWYLMIHFFVPMISPGGVQPADQLSAGFFQPGGEWTWGRDADWARPLRSWGGGFHDDVTSAAGRRAMSRNIPWIEMVSLSIIDIDMILWMEEILHHLGWLKPYK